MSKTITISDELEEKIVAFCDDELNYHINESRHADEYKDEITAQIELLKLLGYKEMADRYESDFKETMKELLGDCNNDYECDDNDDDEDELPLDKNLSSEELAKEKLAICEEWDGYGNGHCSYMICGIKDEDALRSYLALINHDIEGIGCYKYREDINTAYFDTGEKYGPALTDVISKEFPKAIVYGTDQWDGSYFDIFQDGVSLSMKEEKSVADFVLVECFEDGGNIRIDISIVDKATGGTISVGDLICCDNVEDVDNIDCDPTYAYLAYYVGDNNRIKEAVEEARKYHSK